ncbi:MAG TPA: MmcQ/YjbR family DNA-binding protein [Planctomycetota bacterium]
MAADPMHDRLLAITLKLPGAYEDWPWGCLHCKVDGKIFVGWGRDEDGEMCVGLRTTLDKQAILVESDPRFSIAAYSGKYGGIDMKLGKKPDWAEVEDFIVGSYRIVAPKKRLKELDGEPAAKTAAKTTKSERPRTAAKVAAKPRKKAAAKNGRARHAR